MKKPMMSSDEPMMPRPRSNRKKTVKSAGKTPDRNPRKPAAFKKGGSVKGAGMCKKGVRPAKTY